MLQHTFFKEKELGGYWNKYQEVLKVIFISDYLDNANKAHSMVSIQLFINYGHLRFRSTSSRTMKVRSWQLCLLLLMMAFNEHDSAKSVYDSFEPKTAANETGTTLFSSTFFIDSYTTKYHIHITKCEFYKLLLSYMALSYDLRLLT